MGTNYYHRTNICECCNRYDETHIGKSSGGWTFSFQGFKKAYEDDETEEVLSYADWLNRLQSGGKIFDEYGDEVSLDEFMALVEMKKGEKRNHTIYCRTHHPGLDNWLDADGHSFSAGEFS
jgi:hypothetical protein